MVEIVRLAPGESPPMDAPFYLVEVRGDHGHMRQHSGGYTYSTTTASLEADVQHQAGKAKEKGFVRLYVQGNPDAPRT